MAQTLNLRFKDYCSVRCRIMICTSPPNKAMQPPRLEAPLSSPVCRTSFKNQFDFLLLTTWLNRMHSSLRWACISANGRVSSGHQV